MPNDALLFRTIILAQKALPFAALALACSQGVAFPTRHVGYATIQSYDTDPKSTQRRVAKTTDGGKTWKELPLVDDKEVTEFGVGFANADLGWVGTTKGGFETVASTGNALRWAV